MPASVFQRLRNLARERGEDVSALLAQYAIERLLYRVSRSSHADRFVLKGAMLFRAWTGALHRPTQDVDLLGFGDAQPVQVAADFAAILREVDDPTDGVTFDHASIVVEEIRGAREYPGVRVRIPATLATANIVVQVDVGFGDAVTPKAEVRDFPVLLGHEAPRIRIYPQETAVAEKFEAICSIGLANSRMKDYYDLLTMSRRFPFDGEVLVEAIRATFERRGTPVPTELPVGLSDAFGVHPDKIAQWKAFAQRTGLKDAPADLGEVVRLVREFLEAPLLAAASSTTLSMRWASGNGWAEPK